MDLSQNQYDNIFDYYQKAEYNNVEKIIAFALPWGTPKRKLKPYERTCVTPTSEFIIAVPAKKDAVNKSSLFSLEFKK